MSRRRVFQTEALRQKQGGQSAVVVVVVGHLEEMRSEELASLWVVL